MKSRSLNEIISYYGEHVLMPAKLERFRGCPRFFCVKINHKKKRIASFAIRYCDVSGKGTVGVAGQGKFKGVFAGGNVEETLADG